MRLLRRLLVPFAIVVVAAAIGTFVIGRTHVAASSPLMENSGTRLTSLMGTSQQDLIEAGKYLFDETCSTCHGEEAEGSSLAPPLRGVGGATVDLWLSEGWMPLRTPENQPENKPPLTRSQIDAIVAYVDSLAPGGVPVPTSVPLKDANVAEGFFLFSLNCAPCHTITGAGDALANGYHAPSMHTATPLEVFEAIRTGPQNMPRFGPNTLTTEQALDVVKYVTKYIRHPRNIGGLGLGGIGPVAEGFVGLFVGVGACLLAAYWVGERTARDASEESSEDEHDGEHDHSEDGQVPGVHEEETSLSENEGSADE